MESSKLQSWKHEKWWKQKKMLKRRHDGPRCIILRGRRNDGLSGEWFMRGSIVTSRIVYELEVFKEIKFKFLGVSIAEEFIKFFCRFFWTFLTLLNSWINSISRRTRGNVFGTFWQLQSKVLKHFLIKLWRKVFKVSITFIAVWTEQCKKIKIRWKIANKEKRVAKAIS